MALLAFRHQTIQNIKAKSEYYNKTLGRN